MGAGLGAGRYDGDAVENDGELGRNVGLAGAKVGDVERENVGDAGAGAGVLKVRAAPYDGAGARVVAADDWNRALGAVRQGSLDGSDEGVQGRRVSTRHGSDAAAADAAGARTEVEE